MIGLIAWVGSYFFRVATKNMTYAVQVSQQNRRKPGYIMKTVGPNCYYGEP